MVVLALVGMTVFLASFFLGDWYDSYKFSGFARSTMSAIKTARVRAISLQKPVQLRFVISSEVVDSAVSDWDGWLKADNTRWIEDDDATGLKVKSHKGAWTKSDGKVWVKGTDSETNKNYYYMEFRRTAKVLSAIGKRYYGLTVKRDDLTDTNDIWFDAFGCAVKSDRVSKTGYTVTLRGYGLVDSRVSPSEVDSKAPSVVVEISAVGAVRQK